MNCYQHPETPAVAYCRSCGRPLCAVCQRPAEGTVFCPEHAPAAAGGYYTGGTGPGAFDPSNPYVGSAGPIPPTGIRTSPALAFILGWIPGVGAIYNGQYIKGLVHAVIFGFLITIADNHSGGPEPFIAMMLMAFVFYMAFEAYHTAKKRQMGIPVAEWSSLSGAQNHLASRAPAGPIILIALGVFFLLDTLHLIPFRDIVRFWPLLLIIAGAAMLYSRVSCLSGPRALPPPLDSNTYTPGSYSAGPTKVMMETRRE
jgi:hypothetical protein